MLLTVFGASFGSSAIVMTPHDVSIVATYVLLVSMLIFGGRAYLPVKRFTVEAVFGVEPPQATPPTGAEGVGMGDRVGGVFGLDPPVRSAAAANPPPPMATASATPAASNRRRRCLRRSA